MTTDDSTALEELLDLLTPDRIDTGTFRPRGPAAWAQHLYGGQLAGQALLAAGRTVAEDRAPHSLHCWFLRPGDPDPAAGPVYEVEVVRDGRALSVREVVARQRGEVIFKLTASFHRAEEGGLEHQDPMPVLAPPDSLPGYEERLSKALGRPVLPLGLPFDMRYAGPLSVEAWRDPALRTASNPLWLRTHGALPGAAPPVVHAALLTYISDILLDTVALRHGLSWTDGAARPRSLDHALWFHRAFRADGWLLLAQETPVAHGGRALVRARAFTHDGTLVASMAQEGLIR